MRRLNASEYSRARTPKKEEPVRTMYSWPKVDRPVSPELARRRRLIASGRLKGETLDSSVDALQS